MEGLTFSIIFYVFFTVSVVNLDPAAEAFSYQPLLDIRDLIQLDDVMQDEDMDFGPNGGLVFCMEYLLEPDGLDWLKVSCVSWR